MKINMAEQRLQPRTRYHSPRWKTHHKLRQIILWNFGKNCFPLQQKIGQLIYISINCACMWASVLCVWVICMCACWVSLCASICLCARFVLCVCVTEREQERGRLGLAVLESNSAVVFEHMILYISCSVGSWTASTAHNTNNMFHMNPTLHHCQRLATCNPRLHRFV